ncbi:hypothetical protein BJX64DRAFT_289859 [Aspergillus heterothallicus]
MATSTFCDRKFISEWPDLMAETPAEKLIKIPREQFRFSLDRNPSRSTALFLPFSTLLRSPNGSVRQLALPLTNTPKLKMPVIECCVLVGCYLTHTIFGGIVGTVIGRYWPFSKKDENRDKNVAPRTNGLSRRDINQLRLKALFRMLEQGQFDEVCMAGFDCLGINVQDFVLRGDGKAHKVLGKRQRVFFKPATLARVDRDPHMDLKDEATRRLVERGGGDWPDTKPPGEQKAQDIATVIGLHFTTMRWKKGNRSFSTAPQFGWKASPMEHFNELDPKFLREKYWPYHDAGETFGHCWYRIFDGCAHIGFTMSHDMIPAEDALQHRELMAIVGVMLTRMKSPYLKDHYAIPVMVISCFEGHKARILQAHLTDCNLVVYKSRLYDFNTPKSRDESLPLFIAYMAGQPVGTTK